mmetsp:Transcript_13857/g.28598  ORF Transcript_13857/g.28598 Transcript_13857/m.28598 type:complete len:109 (-) Transcript_13857:371-697(-)|eukprot:CAMPEP_0197268032 /NCGR_PEP_ID=MMETSP1432-20130617/3937_1 /TAXON_ID=44447 /ORGANISM="Pseudo-nitzschia delicatissima, Strain UNC1205" /LENGTH=108 /DNA_ID=CAMNT_0042733043 /DNA_START=226 /DNA_END=552 /DNA_ORIENTATION=+
MAVRFQQLWLFVVVVLMATCGALAKEDERSLDLRRNRRAAIDVIHILPEEHRRGRERARGLKNEKSSKSKKSKGMKSEKEPKAHTLRGIDADLSEVFFSRSMSMSMSM